MISWYIIPNHKMNIHIAENNTDYNLVQITLILFLEYIIRKEMMRGLITLSSIKCYYGLIIDDTILLPFGFVD